MDEMSTTFYQLIARGTEKRIQIAIMYKIINLGWKLRNYFIVLGTYSSQTRQWLFTEELRELCEIQPLK